MSAIAGAGSGTRPSMWFGVDVVWSRAVGSGADRRGSKECNGENEKDDQRSGIPRG